MPQLHLLIDALPRRARVIRAKHAAFFCLNNRIHNVRFAGGDAQADASQNSLRQTRIARNICPVRAAVGGLVNAAARTAAGKSPRLADRFPHRGVHELRMIRVIHQTDGPGVIVHEQNFVPRFATIGGLEHAAVGIGSEHMSHGSDVDNVRILGINDNRAGRMRVAQTRVLPRLASVV